MNVAETPAVRACSDAGPVRHSVPADGRLRHHAGMSDPGHAVVLVSWLDPRDLPANATRVLDREERSRLHAGTAPRDVRRRAAAGVLLRCLVASALGQEPHDVTVRRHCPHCSRGHGRPEVPGAPLRVSASHAGDRVAVAVAVSTLGAVGIDVEPPRARPLSRPLLRRTLGSGEPEYLLGVPESRRPAEFLRIWTAKEAILKATGEGLRGGPRLLALDLRAIPLRLHSWAGSTARAGTVRLVELDPGGGHVATLATLGADAVSVVHREGRALVERMTA